MKVVKRIVLLMGKRERETRGGEEDGVGFRKVITENLSGMRERTWA